MTRLGQDAKAFVPIVVTDLGIYTFSRFAHEAKAPAPTIVTLLGIITSLFACLHTASLPFQKKLGKKTPFLATSAVFLLSMLGFETIVNNCYPVFGFFGIIITFKILLSNHKTSSHNFKKF